MAPVCIDLVAAAYPEGEMPPITQEQALAFIYQIFDQDGDSTIDRAEWVYVVEYISVCHAIEVRMSRAEKKEDAKQEPSA